MSVQVWHWSTTIVLVVGICWHFAPPHLRRRCRARRRHSVGETCETCGKLARYEIRSTFSDDGEGQQLPDGWGTSMSASYCRRHRPEGSQRLSSH